MYEAAALGVLLTLGFVYAFLPMINCCGSDCCRVLRGMLVAEANMAAVACRIPV